MMATRSFFRSHEAIDDGHTVFLSISTQGCYKRGWVHTYINYVTTSIFCSYS